MTLEATENIIERALVSLLAQKAAPIAEVTVVKKKRIRGARSLASRLTAEAGKKERLPARISVVERLSSATLSICWSDATSGYFGEQVWRAGVAHVQSFCALSGIPIRIGDSVFRPWVSEIRAPANSHRMILASSVGMSFPRL